MRFLAGFFTNLAASFFAGAIISPNFVGFTTLATMVILLVDILAMLICARLAIEFEKRLK